MPLLSRTGAVIGSLVAAGALLAAVPAAADPLREQATALFWDTRLSADGKTACASCHLQEDWGADARKRSLDARGKLTERHAQTVLNTQGATAGLRWLADRANGMDQALGSITGSMGFERREDLVAALRAYNYTDQFRQAFPNDVEPASAENYARAAILPADPAYPGALRCLARR